MILCQTDIHKLRVDGNSSIVKVVFINTDEGGGGAIRRVGKTASLHI